ncbi:MAG: hypothetical protein NZO16_07210 [Deltaproteobacteria bacterium]|nr:hypothetical protein [Deltaproteobacteria bacterium]
MTGVDQKVVTGNKIDEKNGAQNFLQSQEVQLNEEQLKNLYKFGIHLLKINSGIGSLIEETRGNITVAKMLLAEGISRPLLAAFGLGQTVADTIKDIDQAMQEDYSKIQQVIHNAIKTRKFSPELAQKLVDYLVSYFSKFNILAEELQNYSTSLPNVAKKAFELVTDAASIVLLPVGGVGLAVKGAQLGIKGIGSFAARGLSRFMSKAGLQAIGLNFVVSACLLTALELHSKSEIAKFFRQLGSDPLKALTELSGFFQNLGKKNPQLAHFCNRANKSVKDLLQQVTMKGKFDEKDLLNIFRYALTASILCSVVAVPAGSAAKQVKPPKVSPKPKASGQVESASSTSSGVKDRPVATATTRAPTASSKPASSRVERQELQPSKKPRAAGKDDIGITDEDRVMRKGIKEQPVKQATGKFRSGKDDAGLDDAPAQAITLTGGRLDDRITELLQQGKTTNEIANLIVEHIKRDLEEGTDNFLSVFVELHANKGDKPPFAEIMDKVFDHIAKNMPFEYVERSFQKSYRRSIWAIWERLPTEKVCDQWLALAKNQETAALRLLFWLDDEKFLEVFSNIMKSWTAQKEESINFLKQKFTELAKQGKCISEIVEYLSRDRYLGYTMVTMDTRGMTSREIEALGRVCRGFLEREGEDKVLHKLVNVGPQRWGSILRWLPSETVIRLANKDKIIYRIDTADHAGKIIHSLDNEEQVISFLKVLKDRRSGLFNNEQFKADLHRIISSKFDRKVADQILEALGITLPQNRRYW